MTVEQLTEKYMNLPVDVERIEERFLHMGKFGKLTVYGFSFETDSSCVSVEFCVKAGKFAGFTPEKEPRADEWGYNSEEYSEEFTLEECSSIARYFDTVLI